MMREQKMWAVVVVVVVATLGGCLSPGETELVDRDTGGTVTNTAPDTTVADGEEVVEPPPLCEVPAGDVTGIDYNTQVKPILTANGCMGCHVAPENLPGLPGTIGTGRVTRQPVVVACDPGGSSLFRVVSAGCADAQAGGARKMPPGTAGVSEADSAIIQQWIAEGAKATFEAGACP